MVIQKAVPDEKQPNGIKTIREMLSSSLLTDENISEDAVRAGDGVSFPGSDNWRRNVFRCGLGEPLRQYTGVFYPN
jgi:hypothetical protein